MFEKKKGGGHYESVCYNTGSDGADGRVYVTDRVQTTLPMDFNPHRRYSVELEYMI